MSKSRILIIDDEKDIRELIKYQLGTGGFKNTIEAGNGKEGINFLKKDGNMKSVGLVLCDLRMPGANGDAVVDFLREQAPEIPVVVIAGHADEATQTSMREKGVKECLIKPVTKDRLLYTVKKNRCQS